MHSAVPRSGQLRGRKGKEVHAFHSKQICAGNLLCVGATLVAKGLALASGNPGLTEEDGLSLRGDLGRSSAQESTCLCGLAGGVPSPLSEKH